MLVAACDDGKVYKLSKGYTVVACTCYDGTRPLGVELGLLRVDGLEATGIVAHLSIAACKSRPNVVLLDSITIAGFNLVSPPGLAKLTGAPVLVVYLYKPSYERLAPAAARAPGPFSIRNRVLPIVDKAVRVDTPKGPLYLLAWGVPLRVAKSIAVSLQVHARTPEPLRVAHMIASSATDALKGLLKECG